MIDSSAIIEKKKRKNVERASKQIVVASPEVTTDNSKGDESLPKVMMDKHAKYYNDSVYN